MAVKRRVRQLETRAQRLRLTILPKPHEFTTIAPGIAVGYRRNVGAGVWVLRVADGKGGNWTKKVGPADDLEDADGVNVLTFWAADKGLKMVRGTDDAAGRPATVAEAVDAYEKDPNLPRG